MPLEEYVGEFSRSIYRDRDGGDFMIGVMQNEDKVKGDAKAGMLQSGGVYRFFGKWQTSDRHGRTFAFAHFIEDEPMTRHGMSTFLMRYGKKHKMTFNRAHALIDAFGSEVFRKIRENPDECAAIMKVNAGDMRAFGAELAAMRHTIHSKVELMALFDGKGFPKSCVDNCIEKWSGRAATVVKSDPFKLLTNKIKGCGFARVDTLYLSLGHDPARMKRQVLAAWNELSKNSEGDTWIPMSRAAQAVRNSIGAADVDPDKAMAIGFRSKLLAKQTHQEIDWVSTGKRANNEEYLAKKIRMMRANPASWPEIEQGSLFPHQFEQAKIALQSNVGVLIGTPGTGKTYTAAALVKTFLQTYSAAKIAVCAPTGKAAVRCAEAMRKEKVDVMTSTIHSLLCPNVMGHGTGDWGFQFNASNKLPISVLVVDEASMVDADLAADLFAALPYDCRVLLIGDPFQLAPVGHGAPLRDLVANGISVGHLTEIHRNAGMIVHACKAIKDNQRFKSAEKFSGKEDNLVVYNAGNEVESLDRLREVFKALAGSNRDLFEDVQVIVPMNTKGALSRVNIAAIIQDIINPRQSDDPLVSMYRPKDKIICTSNDLYESSAEKGARLYVANGEMGRVVAVKDMWVSCVFPPAAGSTDPRHIHFNEKSDDGNCFALGYAITAHKSQGSQWPFVIVIVDPAAGRVANKEWHYTAFSRAGERCLIIGQKIVAEKQARTSSLSRRKTFLAEHLRGEFDSAAPTT